MESDVHLDQHVHASSRGRDRRGPAPRNFQVIDDEREIGARQESEHAWGVDGMNRVGKSDVSEAGGGKHLGFAQLGAANADGAAIDLPARHFGALVSLGVRPNSNAAAIGGILQTVDVSQCPLAVDEHRGRRQIAEGHGGILSVQSSKCKVQSEFETFALCTWSF
jgi:hypothetical protein